MISDKQICGTERDVYSSPFKFVKAKYIYINTFNH